MNIKMYMKLELKGEDLILLHMIRDNSNGKWSKELRKINKDYKEFFEKGYVRVNNRKNKNQDMHDLIRIDKKGNKVLTDLYTYSPDEDTKKLVDWVIETYKGIGKFCKNKKEAYKRCQFFSENSGIKRNKLAVLIQTFMQNVYNPEVHGDNFYEAKKENPYLVLSNQVENIFWNKPNLFAKHYNLDDSPLYNFYLENEEHFLKQFERYEN